MKGSQGREFDPDPFYSPFRCGFDVVDLVRACWLGGRKELCDASLYSNGC